MHHCGLPCPVRIIGANPSEPSRTQLPKSSPPPVAVEPSKQPSASRQTVILTRALVDDQQRDSAIDHLLGPVFQNQLVGSTDEVGQR
jgi:hypothetical protein